MSTWLPGFLIEDLTDRFDPNYTLNVDVEFHGRIKAHIDRAWRIGDCIRATFVYRIMHYGKVVTNYCDQWYFPTNGEETCELTPISKETAEALNNEVRRVLKERMTV